MTPSQCPECWHAFHEPGPCRVSPGEPCYCGGRDPLTPTAVELVMRLQALRDALHPYTCGTIEGPGEPECNRLAREIALDAERAARAGVIDAAHLERQREFSERTFGPGPRTNGVLDHIRKELAEIEAEPLSMEWIDVVILALDGAWRAGHEPQEIIDAIIAKQAKNEARAWPDWRTAAPDTAIEHDRSAERAPRADTKTDACPVCGNSGRNRTCHPAEDFVSRLNLPDGDPRRNGPMRAPRAGTPGADMIAAERRRQIEVEGYDPEHDEDAEALALAAIAYALPSGLDMWVGGHAHESDVLRMVLWPWDSDAYKPKDARRDLVRAGALIAAAIDALAEGGGS